MEDNNKKDRIVLGIDISTTTIGCCLLLDDGSKYGKVIELTHVKPKINNKIKGIESLFLKANIFKEEFLHKYKDIGISDIIIEEPLLSSNNTNTCGTLLRFNGMVSRDCYDIFGIVPEFISSYDARKYSFPELMSIRKFGKNGLPYEDSKILNSVKKKQFVLFGAYPWDVDKKQVLQGKVSELFPQIEWIYNKKGELTKENFDASDAYVAILGYLNKEKYGEPQFSIDNLQVNNNIIEYDLLYWDRKENRKIYLDEKTNS